VKRVTGVYTVVEPKIGVFNPVRDDHEGVACPACAWRGTGALGLLRKCLRWPVFGACSSTAPDGVQRVRAGEYDDQPQPCQDETAEDVGEPMHAQVHPAETD
jgi:hypothetical protein